MLYENVYIFARALRVIDAMTLGISAGALWVGAVHWNIWPASTRDDMLLFVGCLVVSFLFVAGRMRIYYARRTEHLLGELVALLQVSLCATGVSCILVEVTSGGLPGNLYGMTALAGTVSLLGTRLMTRLVLCRLRRGGRDYRTWLVVGRNARSAQIAEEILANPHFGICIAQVIDLPGRADGDSIGRIEAFTRPPLAQLPQAEVGNAEMIRELLVRCAIDEVVVCLPVRSFYAETEQILHICGEAGISVKLPSQAFNCPDHYAALGRLGTIPLVTHYSGPANFTFLAVKRVLDIVGAVVGLLLLLPVHAVIAIAIKLTSPGRVFFRQQRVGLHGRPFTLVKYRTMVVDAPQRRALLSRGNDTDGPAFKMKDDPRVTTVGRFLRKHHLDELPQLWNVLVGEMSLVGPRPLPPEEANGNAWWQRRRLSMPPGLTCLWQVNGDYEVSFKRWMEMDLEYIDRWSLLLDLRLILATFGVVLRGSGSGW